jgi:hypothetical protein
MEVGFLLMKKKEGALHSHRRCMAIQLQHGQPLHPADPRTRHLPTLLPCLFACLFAIAGKLWRREVCLLRRERKENVRICKKQPTFLELLPSSTFELC